jgi:hypothetical protein
LCWGSRGLQTKADKVKLTGNKEIAKVIGRRLKEALASADSAALPASISFGLEALRQAEVRLASSVHQGGQAVAGQAGVVSPTELNEDPCDAGQ